MKSIIEHRVDAYKEKSSPMQIALLSLKNELEQAIYTIDQALARDFDDMPNTKVSVVNQFRAVFKKSQSVFRSSL